MPRISAMSSARCGEGLAQPLGVETLGVASSQYYGTTEGATGVAPLVKSICDERPVCQSCENMRPPLAWTAPVIFCKRAMEIDQAASGLISSLIDRKIRQFINSQNRGWRFDICFVL